MLRRIEYDTIYNLGAGYFCFVFVAVFFFFFKNSKHFDTTVIVLLSVESVCTQV